VVVPDRQHQSLSSSTGSGGQAPTQPNDHPEVVIALSDAMERGDFDQATEIVRDNWAPLLRSDYSEVQTALERLPVAELRSHPLLTMLLATAYNGIPRCRVKGLRYFAIASHAANASAPELNPLDQAFILSTQAAAFRLVGRPGLGIKPAIKAIRILDHLREPERRKVIELPRLYSQLGISLYYAGQTDAALDAFEKGLAEAPAVGPSSAFGNVSMLAGIHAIRGDLQETDHILAIAREDRWTDQQRSWYPGTFYRLGEALSALESFDAAAAREHVSAMVHDRRTIEHWVSIGITEALTDAVEGNPGRGLSGLDALAVLRGGEGRSSRTRASLATTRALLQLAAGKADAASVILKRDAPPGPYRSIGRARVELAVGRHGTALRELQRIAGATLTSRQLAEALAIECAALMKIPGGSLRMPGLIDQLGSLLERTGQRLAIAMLPSADMAHVVTGLCNSGYSRLFDGIPIRALVPTIKPDALLSQREIAVLRVLVTTTSVSQIASELTVSKNTVKTQMKSLYRKLGASSRDEALAIAWDRHLLAEDDE
jgi:DNA-binding CsgD family transcriptional regulator/tetratricopeptide (TPR) repeat protein